MQKVSGELELCAADKDCSDEALITMKYLYIRSPGSTADCQDLGSLFDLAPARRSHSTGGGYRRGFLAGVEVFVQGES